MPRWPVSRSSRQLRPLRDTPLADAAEAADLSAYSSSASSVCWGCGARKPTQHELCFVHCARFDRILILAADALEPRHELQGLLQDTRRRTRSEPRGDQARLSSTRAQVPS